MKYDFRLSTSVFSSSDNFSPE
ncbi:hypothetical protein CP02DC14_0733A, partial [Chlamydia psittaci 02DC14]